MPSKLTVVAYLLQPLFVRAIVGAALPDHCLDNRRAAAVTRLARPSDHAQVFLKLAAHTIDPPIIRVETRAPAPIAMT